MIEIVVVVVVVVLVVVVIRIHVHNKLQALLSAVNPLQRLPSSRMKQIMENDAITTNLRRSHTKKVNIHVEAILEQICNLYHYYSPKKKDLGDLC